MAKNSWSSIQNINNWRLWIWKKNALLNLINNEPDIHKIYLYAKDQYKGKHQLLINKRESAGLNIVLAQKLLLNIGWYEQCL